MRISDWSSDVCSSDLLTASAGNRIDVLADDSGGAGQGLQEVQRGAFASQQRACRTTQHVQRLIGDDAFAFCHLPADRDLRIERAKHFIDPGTAANHGGFARDHGGRSEEHTSELQSLMRNSYAVFCLKKK